MFFGAAGATRNNMVPGLDLINPIENRFLPLYRGDDNLVTVLEEDPQYITFDYDFAVIGAVMLDRD